MTAPSKPRYRATVKRFQIRQDTKVSLPEPFRFERIDHAVFACRKLENMRLDGAPSNPWRDLKPFRVYDSATKKFIGGAA